MKLTLVFPGQGSQYVGMGKQLYDRYAEAREIFEQADDTLGFNLTKLCFDGDMDQLTRTDNAQPAILTVSVAAFEVFKKEFDTDPMLLAGHSLGEFSALTCAGIIDFNNALKIVRQRGRLMNEFSVSGGMAAVNGIERHVVEEMCGKLSTGSDNIVVVSNYNSNNQIVISGHKNLIKEITGKLENAGAEVAVLKVSAAFHSPLMGLAAEKFKEELVKYKYNKGKWRVVSNVSARPYSEQDNIIDLLTLQMIKPVQWQKTMEYFEEQGVTECIELGPKTVLGNLVRQSMKNINSYSFDREEDINKFKERFKIAEINENTDGSRNAQTVIARCLAVAVCTRNKNWNNTEYQNGVVQPYKKIREVQKGIEQQGVQPTTDQIIQAFEMLKSVFKTKKTPADEQMERFNQILDETGTRDIFSNYDFAS